MIVEKYTKETPTNLALLCLHNDKNHPEYNKNAMDNDTDYILF